MSMFNGTYNNYGFTAWANQIKQLTPAPFLLPLTTVQYQRPDPGSSTRVSMEECCKLLQNKLKNQ